MGIALSGGTSCDVTIISNRFIDHFMPHANGACIKTYLYLLRSLSAPGGAELSISTMAASLGDTEGDILRAVSWLEQCGLLRTTRSGDAKDASGMPAGELTEISLIDLTADRYAAGHAAEENSSSGGVHAPLGHTPVIQVPVVNVPVVDIPVIKNQTAAAKTRTEELSVRNPASAEQADPEIPTYSKSQIEKLSSNEEVKWIMSIAERYLERLLNPADIQLIVYLYESAGFPAELILYLYEYCASRDKKSPSYIERVALNWAKEGILTVEQAETASFKYNAPYQAVVRAFGMNRMPGTAEQNYIDRWSKKFGFSAEMIEEACSRSLLSTQRPDFKYADRILENWHKKGITTKQDILQADQIHSQNAARTAANKTENLSRAVPKSNNRFNAFPQRSYSGEEFSSMEQRLLNRGN